MQKGAESAPFRFQSLLQVLFDPRNRFNYVIPIAKGRQAEVAFPAGAETGTGGADNVTFGQQLVEELPTGHAARCFQPDIGGVDAAIDCYPHFRKAFADDSGVLHVIIDGFFGLSPPFVRVDGSCCLLYRVGGTVKLGGGTAQPEFVETVTFSG